MSTKLLVLCIVLGVLDHVVSIARISDDDTASAFVVDSNDIDTKNYEIQRDIQPAAIKWKNLLKLQDTQEATNGSDLFTFSQLSAVPSKQVGGVIRYSVGKRLSSEYEYMNDRLVGHSADGKRWSVPQDVTLVLRYPNSGQGALITYVEVIVDQSSNLGQAHVISGGIGLRNIAVAVEAKSTLWFTYSANIYGL